MKKLNDVTIISISVAAIVFGVLFCLNNVIGATLDIVFGVSFIILGTVLTGLSLSNRRSVLSVQGIAGGAVIALGITVIAVRGLVAYFIYDFVPFAFIVLGVLLIVEAFLLLFLRNSKKSTLFIVELCVGVVMLALGILAVAIFDVQFKAFNIIEGVILIAAGMYVLIAKLVIKRDEE